MRYRKPASTPINHDGSQFKGLSIYFVDNCGELLKDVAGFVRCNWEGEVKQVLTCNHLKFSDVDQSFFEPIDKGGIGCFAYNKFGAIIFGIALYSGDYNCPEGDEYDISGKIITMRGPHYFMIKRDSTDPYWHDSF